MSFLCFSTDTFLIPFSLCLGSLGPWKRSKEIFNVLLHSFLLGCSCPWASSSFPCLGHFLLLPVPLVSCSIQSFPSEYQHHSLCSTSENCLWISKAKPFPISPLAKFLLRVDYFPSSRSIFHSSRRCTAGLLFPSPY